MMNRRTVTSGLTLGMLLVGCATRPSTPAPASGGLTTVYVGTYTKDSGSKGIYRLSLDLVTGAMVETGSTSGIENPSFLAIHPNKKFLYAAAEVEEMGGAKTGGVKAYAIAADGSLTELNQQPSGGGAPCHLSMDRDGKHLLVANYVGGNVSIFPIALDGSLQPASAFVQHEGGSTTNPRQSSPHAHSINLSSDNQFAFVADLGLDEVRAYRYDATAGTLVAHDAGTIRLAAGSGPRHFSFSPSGKFAYVNGEMTSEVNAYSYDKVAGTFSALNTLSTLPDGGKDGNSTAEVVVSPNGKFVYVSNRGHDSLAIFAVNADGTLVARGHQSTGGKTPRNFAIDPTGTFLLAANQRSNTVVSFRINSESGTLTPTGHSIAVPAPVCVRYLQ
jgi:6-phosphogluconolactonase